VSSKINYLTGTLKLQSIRATVIGQYTGRWWVGCYIWLTASVPTSYYSMWHYNCLCTIKGWWGWNLLIDIRTHFLLRCSELLYCSAVIRPISKIIVGFSGSDCLWKSAIPPPPSSYRYPGTDVIGHWRKSRLQLVSFAVCLLQSHCCGAALNNITSAYIHRRIKRTRRDKALRCCSGWRYCRVSRCGHEIDDKRLCREQDHRDTASRSERYS